SYFSHTLRSPYSS
ncbi:putative membrane domain protein, partial [Chlamydia psittaci 08DC60]